MNRLGFIGAGNMGSALIRGLIDFGGMEADHVYVCGHHPEILNAFAREKGFYVCESVEELLKECDTVLFAVKPKHTRRCFRKLAKTCLGRRCCLSSPDTISRKCKRGFCPVHATCISCPTRRARSARARSCLKRRIRCLTRNTRTCGDALRRWGGSWSFPRS